jgi:hypothetical protein
VIRIVGLQRSESTAQEFVLLQNQGSLRLSLKGHLVVSEAAIQASDLSFAAHAFSDDVQVPPGMYILLATGRGQPRWTKTKEGALVYYAYMNRDTCVWEQAAGPLHILSPQHTYTERQAPLLLR